MVVLHADIILYAATLGDVASWWFICADHKNRVVI